MGNTVGFTSFRGTNTKLRHGRPYQQRGQVPKETRIKVKNYWDTQKSKKLHILNTHLHIGHILHLKLWLRPGKDLTQTTMIANLSLETQFCLGALHYPEPRTGCLLGFTQAVQVGNKYSDLIYVSTSLKPCEGQIRCLLSFLAPCNNLLHITCHMSICHLTRLRQWVNSAQYICLRRAVTGHSQSRIASLSSSHKGGKKKTPNLGCISEYSEGLTQ